MNVTRTTDQLSDHALEIVAGGLNPQPLPPGPPPEMFAMRMFKINVFSIARFFSFGR